MKAVNLLSHMFIHTVLKKAEIGVGGSVDLFADLSAYFKLDICRLVTSDKHIYFFPSRQQHAIDFPRKKND